jgi:hypothetical protein
MQHRRLRKRSPWQTSIYKDIRPETGAQEATLKGIGPANEYSQVSPESTSPWFKLGKQSGRRVALSLEYSYRLFRPRAGFHARYNHG